MMQQQVEIGVTFEEGFVEADGFHIRFQVGGTGLPLVYVHGAGGPDVGLAHQLLAKNYRVVVLEMPGWGTSPDNAKTVVALDMARSLRAAVAALGIESYALWGTSLGGVIASWWATEYPDEVVALVLEAPAVFRVADPDPVALSNWDTFVTAFHAQPQRKPWLAEKKFPAVRDGALFMRLMGERFDDELTERLRTFPVATLVLIGTKDGVMSTKQGRTFAQIMPECRFVMVYDAAHDLKGDRPEAFAEVVHQFLEPGSFLINHSSSILNP
jgi:pimeloyl-ACP methyl ester carboxylesterase